MTITEFLTARLDEDEATARAASPGPWRTNAESDEVVAVDGITVTEGFALSGPQLRATTTHIARHDPAHVLADVAAKRAIVDVHTEGSDYSASYGEPEGTLRTCSECGPSEDVKWQTGGKGYWPCLTLKYLAQPYAEHPDFDEAWRAA